MKRTLILLAAIGTSAVLTAGEEVLPAWATIADDASAAKVVRGVGAWLPPPVCREKGVVRLTAVPPPKPFSTVSWEIAAPCDLSDAAGISFDIRCPAENAFAGTQVFFMSGKSWYAAPFTLFPDDGWQHVRVFRCRAKAAGAAVAGWKDVSAIRLYASYRNGRPVSFEVANFAKMTGSEKDLLRQDGEEHVRRSAEICARTRPRIEAMPGKSGERRMICVHPWLMKPDYETVVAKLAAYGFTDLIPLVSWSEEAYHPSKVLPVSERTDFGADAKVLPELLAACHRHGMRLLAWHIFYYTGSRIRPQRTAELAAAGRLAKIISPSAKNPYGNAPILCPSHPENIRQEIAAAVELAGLGVDGVLYDYIRYPSRDFCFCDGCRARFEKEIGETVPNWPEGVRTDSRLAGLWGDFRRANITSVVRESATRIHAEHPGVPVCISARASVEGARENDAQDWKLWCREGWADLLCPMDYTTSSDFLRVQMAEQREGIGRAKFYPLLGLSASGIPDDGLDAWRVANHIRTVREAGLDGFGVFCWGVRGEAALDVLAKGPLKR